MGSEYGAITGILRASDAPTLALIGNEDTRVWRCTWWAAVTGAGVATADDDTAVTFAPQIATATGVPTAGNPGWGVRMDGSGAWEYVNYGTGAFPANISEVVAFPVGTITDIAAWNFFDAQLIMGAPARDAAWSLLVNNTTIVTRNWVSADAGELADFGDIGAGLGSTIYGWQCNVDNDGNADVAVLITNIHVTMGRYTRGGVEIFS